MLTPSRSPKFDRDVKRLINNHVNLKPLRDVMRLILIDTEQAKAELRRRHNAHMLKGELSKVNECHVANVGDWLLLWKCNDTQAVFMRTGKHDEVL